MTGTFQIEIATPERLLVSAQAMRAQIPAKEGYIGVLPDHAPLLSELGYGALTYTTANDHCFSFSYIPPPTKQVQQGYLILV